MAELILPSGHIALVDDQDFAAVVAAGPWRVSRNKRMWYVRRDLSHNRQQLLHRLLTGYPLTDHANGDGLDNRRANLRPCNNSLNGANRIPVHARSGYRGVARRPSGRWRAGIRVDGRDIHLGMFDTAEEAARAYDSAATAAWGAYARPNFPRACESEDGRLPVRAGASQRQVMPGTAELAASINAAVARRSR
jgi:hypothetical protein